MKVCFRSNIMTGVKKNSDFIVKIMFLFDQFLMNQWAESSS